ncbi:MAG: hypothetical protein WD575_04045, partial [Nitriliruptoraceae bacterium]
TETDHSPPGAPDEAFVVPTSRRRVDVTGDDRARYLQDVTSQDLVDVPVGEVRGALHLDVHGTVLAMFDVVVLGDRLALVVDDDASADLVTERLGGRTFLLDARFGVTDDRALAVRGPGAADVLAAVGLGHVAGRARLADDVLVVPVPGGADLLGPAETVDAVHERLVAVGARAGDADDLRRWRVDQGVPGWGHEVVAPHLPEEAGLLPSHVHLGKGCYPGQEAVARMWMLGRPRRRLAIVRVDADAVTEGWEAGEGRDRVTVTTRSPSTDRALAFVPGDRTAGDVLEVDGVAVEVVRLVGDDVSPPGSDPAVTRGRDRRRSVNR